MFSVCSQLHVQLQWVPAQAKHIAAVSGRVWEQSEFFVRRRAHDFMLFFFRQQKEVKEPFLEATAFGNLGIAKMNLSRHEEAIGCFEQQIACLEQMDSSELNPATAALHNKDVEKGRAFGHLGNCYEALTDFEEAAKCHEQYLSHSLRAKSVKDQDKAYRELGQAYKHLGNLQQALVRK